MSESVQPRLTATDAVIRERFAKLANLRDLAALLEVPYGLLVYHLYRAPSAGRYRTFGIPKRSGHTRTIMAPATPIKLLQRKLHHVLSLVYVPKPSAHGFVQHRSILTNAAPHVRRRLVLNIDLLDFFPSINFGRVYGLFLRPPYSFPKPVSAALAQLCCHHNQLPQGAPTSPIVANMICRSLDRQLQKLAARSFCTYTRYVDDLTFSTTRRALPPGLVPPTEAGSPSAVGADLSAAIQAAGFAINMRKVRLMRPHERQEVAGLTVNRFPNVSRRLVRQIRCMLHAWERFGEEQAQREYLERHQPRLSAGLTFKRVLWGKITFVGQIRGTADPLFQKLAHRYAALDPYVVPPKLPAPDDPVQRALDGTTWVLSCETQFVQGTAFMLDGVGLVSCAHSLGSATKAFRPPGDDIAFDVQVKRIDRSRDVVVLDLAPGAKEEWGPFPAMSRAPVPATGLRLLTKVYVAGYPNYCPGNSLTIHPGHVSGERRAPPEKRVTINTGIVAGMSGGPVVDDAGRVVGIAVRGASAKDEMDGGAEHAVIPIDALDRLPPLGSAPE